VAPLTCEAQQGTTRSYIVIPRGQRRINIGTHKSEFLPLRKLQKYTRRILRKSKFMSAAEAERRRQALTELYRSHFVLNLHPLQSSLTVVPPAEVIDKVQGSNKSDANTFLGSGYRDMVRYIEELSAHGYDLAAMDRMLDFGCGTGRMLLHFLPFRLERYGCDVNPAAVEWTSHVLGKFVDIRLSKPEPPLPYQDNFFDLVIAASVFTHIPVGAQPGWIAELARVLKPGACVIATVHDFSKITIRHRKAGWHQKELERGLHMNSYVTAEALEKIWGTTFDILEVRRYPPGQAHLIARPSPQSL
jgi:SAM-dependent methyltransferase